MSEKVVKTFVKTIEPLAFLAMNAKRLLRKGNRKLLSSVVACVSWRTSKAKPLVVIDLIAKCFAACGIYSDYITYHLYERTLTEARRFCGFCRTAYILPVLQSKEAAEIFNNKPRFHSVFNKYTKREFLYVGSDTPYEIFELFVRRHPVFIAKPTNANHGHGVWLVDVSRFNNVREIPDVILRRQTTLIEEHIQNHPVLSQFSSTSLNTIRLITVRLPEGVKLIAASLKFNTEGGVADQFGYVCPIDMETGRVINVLGDFMTTLEPIDYAPEEFTIPGTQIPYWNEAVEMAKEATLYLDDVYFVPWDIAITESGPLIIEGNCFPSFTFQDFHNRPCYVDLMRAMKFAKSNRRTEKKRKQNHRS
jgi:hypothetical protein